MEEYICKYCGRKTNSKIGNKCHERYCKKNPNRKICLGNNGATKGYKGHNQYTKAKELGLPIPKMSEETKKKILVARLGVPLTEEHKKKISDGRKKFLNEHPDKVPFKLNHSSRQSYPERYFQIIFKKEKIDLEYHRQVKRYELDFSNIDKMKYVEIDGEQHYTSKYMINHDIERTKFLSDLGWEGIRIRWKDYKKMNIEERKNKIEEIRRFLES